MNILVIGNGFDLAHGLPTKYIDFLEWVKAEYALYLDSNGNKALIEGEIRVDWAIKSYPSKISVKMIKDMILYLKMGMESVVESGKLLISN